MYPPSMYIFNTEIYRMRCSRIIGTRVKRDTAVKNIAT
jgi:hypothetical protein